VDAGSGAARNNPLYHINEKGLKNICPIFLNLTHVCLVLHALHIHCGRSRLMRAPYPLARQLECAGTKCNRSQTTNVATNVDKNQKAGSRATPPSNDHTNDIVHETRKYNGPAWKPGSHTRAVL
jgi:hypothetical protein